MLSRVALTLALTLTAGRSLLAEDVQSVTIRVDAGAPTHRISPYLLGIHFVYCNEPDAMFTNGLLAAWARDAHVATARYPGGTVVKFWDWQNPTGVIDGDPWDPNWKASDNQPGSEFMDLDEYLAFCKKAKIEPMVGVNCTSGYQYGRIRESVRRAADCVRACKRQGMPVKWWYVGNETAHLVGKLQGYALLVREHAEAMKRVDPAIKVFLNDNGITPDRLRQYLKICGDAIDGIEFHGKWKDGGAIAAGATFDMWKQEAPLREASGIPWSERLRALRKAAREAGRPDLLFANNEWGLGPRLTGFDKFTYSLAMIDYLQDLFIGGYDMACLWSASGDPDKMLTDRAHRYALNPIAYGFKLLSATPNRLFLAAASSNPLVYGFACLGGRSEVQVFLLNKTEQPQVVRVSVANFEPQADSKPAAATLQAPGDVIAGLTIAYRAEDRTYEAALPPLSYTRLTLHGKAALPKSLP